MLKITLWNNKKHIFVRLNQGYFIKYENAHSSEKKKTLQKWELTFLKLKNKTNYKCALWNKIKMDLQ